MGHPRSRAGESFFCCRCLGCLDHPSPPQGLKREQVSPVLGGAATISQFPWASGDALVSTGGCSQVAPSLSGPGPALSVDRSGRRGLEWGSPGGGKARSPQPGRAGSCAPPVWAPPIPCTHQESGGVRGRGQAASAGDKSTMPPAQRQGCGSQMRKDQRQEFH